MKCKYHNDIPANRQCTCCGAPLCNDCQRHYKSNSIICNRCAKQYKLITKEQTYISSDENIEFSKEIFEFLVEDTKRINPTINNYTPNVDIPIGDYFRQPTTLRKSTSLKHLSDFVVIDIETTGLHAGHDKILQVAAVRFKNFKLNEIFDTYIHPHKHIPQEITNINGITNEMVSNAPTFTQIRESLENFIGESTIVGQNVFFDLKFLRKNGYDSEKVKRNYYDTCSITQKFVDSYNHKLDTLCGWFSIYPPSFHSAVNDAVATGMLFLCCIEHYMPELFPKDSRDILNTYDKYKEMRNQLFAEIRAEREAEFNAQTFVLPKYEPPIVRTIPETRVYPVDNSRLTKINSSVNETNLQILPETKQESAENFGKRKQRDKWTAFVYCLVFGILGLHKFYDGEIGMGILYLFTGGLFFIGIIVDLIIILKRPTIYYV